MTFQIPGPFADDTPLEALHLWQWARSVPRADAHVMGYLRALGFRHGVDTLSVADSARLRRCVEHFRFIEPHIAEPLTFEQAFPGEGRFWVQGKPGRYSPAPVIVEALTRAGWIYDVNPQTTYFAIVNGILWAKYQQILGQRSIARVSE